MGGRGHLSAFSFYPTKNLGAYSDGGAVLTNDPTLSEQVKWMRQYGWRGGHVSEQKGINARLDEMQAAILRVKLCHLDTWNARRRELAALYRTLLIGSDLDLPIEPPDSLHVYHQFVIRHPKRDSLQAFLAEQGIHTQIHYPIPIHLQPAYLELKANPLPVTESIANQILSLPLYPEMTNDMAMAVCSSIMEFNSSIKIGSSL